MSCQHLHIASLGLTFGILIYFIIVPYTGEYVSGRGRGYAVIGQGFAVNPRHQMHAGPMCLQAISSFFIVCDIIPLQQRHLFTFACVTMCLHTHTHTPTHPPTRTHHQRVYHTSLPDSKWAICQGDLCLFPQKTGTPMQTRIYDNPYYGDPKTNSRKPHCVAEQTPVFNR